MERAGVSSTYAGAYILIYPLLTSLLLSFFISGCDTPNKTLPYALIITENGLGTLHPNTPFNQVNTSLIGFEFEKLSQISPEHPELIFSMKRGGKEIAQIVSDSSGKKIASIYILSPLIKNKDKVGIGDPLPPSETLHCINDVCQNKDEPSLHYRIDPKARTIREITFSRL